jgi:hypothetical protein
LHSRASFRAVSPEVKLTPGVVTESIAMATPALSMSARDFSTVQLFIGGSPKLFLLAAAI